MAAENWTATNHGMDLTFYTLNKLAGWGGTEKMRLTSEGGLAFNGATNYGASGQVLTSNGNAPPIWSDAGTSMLAGSSNNTLLSAGLTYYFPLTCNCAPLSYLSDVQGGTRTLISRAGTIKNMSIKISATPTNPYVITLILNGVAQTMTVTATTVNTLYSDTIHPITVSAGDEVAITVVTGAGTQAKIIWSFDFTY